MGVLFDCQPATLGPGKWAPKGEPLRARTCNCGPLQRVDADGLCRCGCWPKETVDETWRRQAERTGYRGPVSSLDADRRRRLELAA